MNSEFSSTFSKIKSAYFKLASLYHPNKYKFLPIENFSPEKGIKLLKTLSNAYEKWSTLEELL